MAAEIDFKGPSFKDFDIVDDEMEEKKSDPIDNRSERSPEKLHARNRQAIQDHLNKALGGNESAIIRLSDVAVTLGINMNTLYRHLKVLREEEFELKKVFNGTRIKRRE
ncbi:MAG: hypothetical protein LBQ58_05635 [Synergistaceae bacterium]|nr:hypothetical protein [Synergistaceae bacterium]